MCKSTLSEPNPVIGFTRTVHLFERHGRIYEVTIVHAALDEWEASPLSQSPLWSANIEDGRVTALRLAF